MPGSSQIWIAQGVYYPDEGVDQIEDDRHASFTLRNGIAIYGGFAGTETSLTERDWKANETILCGDINQSNTLDGNSFSVVTGSGTDSSAVLDGVTIRRGHSNGSGIGLLPKTLRKRYPYQHAPRTPSTISAILPAAPTPKS